MKKDEYYKAYEKRYKQVYNKKMMWFSSEPTPDVFNTINKLNITKGDKILDLGCGEGRDTIYLLNNGYNVLGIDYSKTVIAKCNEITSNKYKGSFKVLDIFQSELNELFNFIYSIAVLHMFVLQNHRDLYLRFIHDHLANNGKALICMLGNGIDSFESKIQDAFKNSKRKVQNNGAILNIATTSCKVVTWEDLFSELDKNGFKVEEYWISKDIPEFNESMCVIISKKDE